MKGMKQALMIAQTYTRDQACSSGWEQEEERRQTDRRIVVQRDERIHLYCISFGLTLHDIRLTFKPCSRI